MITYHYIRKLNAQSMFEDLVDQLSEVIQITDDKFELWNEDEIDQLNHYMTTTSAINREMREETRDMEEGDPKYIIVRDHLVRCIHLTRAAIDFTINTNILRAPRVEE